MRQQAVVFVGAVAIRRHTEALPSSEMSPTHKSKRETGAACPRAATAVESHACIFHTSFPPKKYKYKSKPLYSNVYNR